MPGDQHRVQRPALRGGAAGDDGHRLHAGNVQPGELAEHVVLVAGHVLRGFLDGDDGAAEVGEAHDVPGDAAGEGGQVFGRPVLEGNVPGQVQQLGLGGGGRDAQRAGDHRGLVVIGAGGLEPGQLADLTVVGGLVVPLGTVFLGHGVSSVMNQFFRNWRACT